MKDNCKKSRLINLERKVSTKMRDAMPRLLRIVLATTMLAACSFGHVELKWVEEVQLSDGQIIVIQRTARGEMQGEAFQMTGWRPTEMRLAFKGLPIKLMSPPELRTKFIPILLDFEASTNAWSVVATFDDCSDWDAFGKPRPPYIEYRTEGQLSSWRIVPLEQRLINRGRNLLTGPSSKGEPELLTIEAKRLRGGNSADVFVKIDEKPFDFHCR